MLVFEKPSSPYNECREGDRTRRVYQPLFDAVKVIGATAWRDAERRADRLAVEEGVTFTLRPGEERILPVDWLPRILPAAGWEKIERGLVQRVRALNEFLRRYYLGKKTPVPDEVVRSSGYFYPACMGFDPPRGVHLSIYGPDLVHMGHGRYLILEDNTRVPSGASYALKYRELTRRLFPDLFAQFPIRPVEGYPAKLRATCEALRPAGADPDGALVLLSEGPWNAAFYDHKILAERAGLVLAFPNDLFCDAEGVWLETATGVRPVATIYRRVQDLDDFVPGLSRAYLEGRVNLVGGWGTGIADDKGTFPYTPEIVREYSGEDPILEIAPTYALLDAQVRAHVLANLEKMVVKPREGYGGHGMLIGPESTRAEREAFRAEVDANPVAFIAQDCLDFSTHFLAEPRGADIHLREAYVDLRTYVLFAGEEASVLPGGISRVAKPGTRVVNSSSGGLIKETWVLAEDAAP